MPARPFYAAVSSLCGRRSPSRNSPKRWTAWRDRAASTSTRQRASPISIFPTGTSISGYEMCGRNTQRRPLRRIAASCGLNPNLNPKANPYPKAKENPNCLTAFALTRHTPTGETTGLILFRRRLRKTGLGQHRNGTSPCPLPPPAHGWNSAAPGNVCMVSGSGARRMSVRRTRRAGLRR